MKILVTGGSGMVGSAVVRAAAAHAPSYTIIAPLHTELDLKNQTQVIDFVHRGGFDSVVHCAARVGGILANKNDQSGFLFDNMMMAMNLFSACRDAGVKNVINLGSSCMYPRNYGLLREEDILAAPLEPTNEGYAIAKIAAAKLCYYISEETGWNYKTLIPCNLYGVGDTYDAQNSHLMPAILMKLHHAKSQNLSSVEIWGDGTPRRELLYVSDLADFIVQHLEDLSPLPSMLNLGAGIDYTITQYYQKVAEIVGYTGDFHCNTDAPNGMMHKLMDCSKAIELGWSPKTSLNDGIAKAYADYCARYAS